MISSEALSFFRSGLIFFNKVECEFVSVSLGAAMHFIDAFTPQMMIKLVNDYKGIRQYVAV